MFSKAILLLVSLIYISKSATVSDLSVRLLRPEIFDDFEETDSDNYVDGDTISIDSSDSVYFVMIFKDGKGYNYEVTIKGNKGGSESGSGTIKYNNNAQMIGFSMGDFKSSSEMEIEAKILDNKKVISSKKITIFLQFDDANENENENVNEATANNAPIITDLSVSLDRPSSSSDYEAKNNMVKGTLTITSLSQFVWFLAKSSNVQNGYKLEFIVEGNNGGSYTPTQDLHGGNAAATTMGAFNRAKSTKMTVTCNIKDSSGNVVSTKSIEIGLNFELRRRLIDMHNDNMNARRMISRPSRPMPPLPGDSRDDWMYEEYCVLAPGREENGPACDDQDALTCESYDYCLLFMIPTPPRRLIDNNNMNKRRMVSPPMPEPNPEGDYVIEMNCISTTNDEKNIATCKKQDASTCESFDYCEILTVMSPARRRRRRRRMSHHAMPHFPDNRCVSKTNNDADECNTRGEDDCETGNDSCVWLVLP